MNILGINISHDSSTCLMKDGQIVFCLEEERVINIKHFSCQSIMPTEYNCVDRIKKYTSKIDYLIFVGLSRNLSISRNNLKTAENIVNKLLHHDISINNIILESDEHHLFHAYNGFYNSGFTEALIIVMDGQGNYSGKIKNYIDPHHATHEFYEIESAYLASYENELNLIYKHCSLGWQHFTDDIQSEYKIINEKNTEYIISNAIGAGHLFEFYAEKFVGDWSGSGKLMGMSSYGTITDTESWNIKGLIFDNQKCNVYMKQNIDTMSFQEKANMAKKIQKETKEYTTNLINRMVEKTNQKNIILSGGYFLNCVNNYEYIKDFPELNFYIDPICYDAGTSIGACYYVWYNILNNKDISRPLTNVYLGG
jgi:carbamoyltransferase